MTQRQTKSPIARANGETILTDLSPQVLKPYDSYRILSSTTSCGESRLSPRTLLNSRRATKLFRQTGCGRFRMLRDRGSVFRPREIGNGDARGLGKPE